MIKILVLIFEHTKEVSPQSNLKKKQSFLKFTILRRSMIVKLGLLEHYEY